MSRPKFRGVSDRGEQMKHRAAHVHERHMSDVRGAVGCYYCWLGQYDKCQHSCQLVRVTDRDHELAAAGESADHRDVLHRWDHSAPVLSHAAQQASSFYNVPAPPEAQRWVAAVGGGKLFLPNRDFVSVTRHVPEQNPWLTASRREQNVALLRTISSNVNQAAVDRVDAHRRRHEQKLFSLLLPEQFVPLYKYPHGSVTVQATPYTQIAMRQTKPMRALSPGGGRVSPPRAGARSASRVRGGGGGDVDNDIEADADAFSAARNDATETRRQHHDALRSASRPVFMQTKHGGRYVSSGSAVYSGAAVRAGTVDNSIAAAAARFAGGGVDESQLTTAEQLRAALEGRSIAALQRERHFEHSHAMRARSAGAGVGQRRSARFPEASLAETSGHVLSGRYTHAMSLPVPDTFASEY